MISKRLMQYVADRSEESQAYRNFVRGITSNYTKRTYALNLKQFMEFYKLTDYDKLAKSSDKEIDGLLLRYLDHLEATGIKMGSAKVALTGIERFFDMNDCIWHKTRIRRSLKKDTSLPGGDEPVTTEEISKMLSCTKSLRTKALVHFLASTGTRPGALIDPVPQVKHLEKIEGCYSIKIYDESKEGYFAFLTPEASQALDAYFQKRRNNGEMINDESPVFATTFYELRASLKSETRKKENQNDHMTDDNARFVINRLVNQAGITRTKKGKRYDKPVVYMFRKRFNTILKMNNAVNSNISEKLMAHKNGLDGTYFKPTKEECFAEFKKAIPSLTIDQTQKLAHELAQKDQRLAVKELEMANIAAPLRKVMGEVIAILDAWGAENGTKFQEETFNFNARDGDEKREMMNLIGSLLMNKTPPKRG